MKKSVLLVDDNEMFLDSCRDVLEDEGYSVTTATGGEEALLYVRARSFCAVVMDIKMAGMNGVESFIAMKKYRPDIRVIMCTAHLVENLILRAEQEGAFRVLTKPFKTDRLLESIEEACRRD